MSSWPLPLFTRLPLFSRVLALLLFYHRLAFSFSCTLFSPPPPPSLKTIREDKELARARGGTVRAGRQKVQNDGVNGCATTGRARGRDATAGQGKDEGTKA